MSQVRWFDLLIIIRNFDVKQIYFFKIFIKYYILNMKVYALNLQIYNENHLFCAA